MTLIIYLSLIALSAAAQLPSKNYLPPGQGSNQAGGYRGTGSGSSGTDYSGPGSGGFSGAGNGNTRQQQAVEKNAQILKLDQEVNENGFSYSYETSNGIRAEEGGNTAQTRGGFAYQGDDGNTYSVTFTAGEGGFQPQGAHLPVPPPTPQEILLALEQNARDEAAGIFDDGLYHPESETGGRRPGASRPGSGQGFGSANHQGGFSPNSGYSY